MEHLQQGKIPQEMEHFQHFQKISDLETRTLVDAFGPSISRNDALCFFLDFNTLMHHMIRTGLLKLDILPEDLDPCEKPLITSLFECLENQIETWRKLPTFSQDFPEQFEVVLQKWKVLIHPGSSSLDA